MKKGKLLALALAGAITLMGAGYASWTDNVNINAVVNTGDMNIQFVNAKRGRIQEGNEYLDFSKNIIISEDKKSVSFEVGNFYPSKDVTDESSGKDGQERPVYKMKTRIENKGNIPAKITDFTVSKNSDGNQNLYDALRVEYGFICKVDRYIQIYDEDICSFIDVKDAEHIGVGRKDDFTLDQFEAHMKKVMKNIELGPNQSIIFVDNLEDLDDLIGLEENEYYKKISFMKYGIDMYLDQSASNETMDKDCTVTFSMKWSQFNN